MDKIKRKLIKEITHYNGNKNLIVFNNSRTEALY